MGKLGLLLCFFCVSCNASLAEGDPKLAELTTYLNAFGEGKTPGIAVALVRGSDVLYTRGFGFRSLADGTKIDSHTRFELASVSKHLTAMAILRLKEDGLLTLSDSVVKFLPELGAFAKSVTIEKLLHHTGGFPDYSELCYAGKQIYNSDILAMLAQKKMLNFSPGEKYDYSNTGYSMLATIIERVSHQTYAQYLKTHLFIPAGMRETFVNEAAIPAAENTAFSYSTWPFFRLQNQPEVLLCNTIYGDGSIYSSAADMAAWNLALDDYKIVSPQTQKLAFESGKTTDGQDIHYGFGWRLETISGHRAFSHGGLWAGYANQVARFPDDDFKVILLGNSQETPHEAVMAYIAHLYLH